MNWARLDVSFFRNPKVIRLTENAQLLYLKALLYSVEHLTDGLVSLPILDALGAKRAATTALVKAGLWDRRRDGIAIHDFDVYQTSARVVRESRKMSRERVQKWRKKQTSEAVANDEKSAETSANPLSGNGVRTPLVTDPQERRGPHSTAPQRILDPAAPPSSETGTGAEPANQREADERLLARALSAETLKPEERPRFADMKRALESGRQRELTHDQRTWALDVLDREKKPVPRKARDDEPSTLADSLSSSRAIVAALGGAK